MNQPLASLYKLHNKLQIDEITHSVQLKDQARLVLSLCPWFGIQYSVTAFILLIVYIIVMMYLQLSIQHDYKSLDHYKNPDVIKWESLIQRISEEN